MDEKVARPTGTDERRKRLDRRLRAAFIEGAEEDSRRRLSEEELERILARYPGDLPER